MWSKPATVFLSKHIQKVRAAQLRTSADCEIFPQVDQYVEREINIHSKLQHPNVIGFKCVSCSTATVIFLLADNKVLIGLCQRVRTAVQVYNLHACSLPLTSVYSLIHQHDLQDLARFSHLCTLYDHLNTQMLTKPVEPYVASLYHIQCLFRKQRCQLLAFVNAILRHFTLSCYSLCFITLVKTVCVRTFRGYTVAVILDP